MDNPVYKMMITNLKAFFTKTAEEGKEPPFNAFDASEVLSVALGKSPDDIVEDIVGILISGPKKPSQREV